MLQWLMRRQLDAFERAFDYDMGYARDILAASPKALMRFGRITGFTQYREDAPVEAYYAAKIAGTMQEDCGSCTQLVVDMALKAGVSPAVLRTIVAGDAAAMPPDAALGFRFAQASLAHTLQANDLREEVVKRWGRKALVSLAFALAAARIFPTLKYALGHGQACMKVRVAEADVLVKQPA
jgi:hypothetical protein